MRRDRHTQGNDNYEQSQADPQLTQAVRIAVEQTLAAMGVEGRQSGKAANGGAQPVKTIDLIGLMFFVLEKFWIVLLAAVICAGAMGMNARKAVPMYTATSKLYIVGSAGTGLSMTDLQIGTALKLDYQEVFKTWEVHEMVREELNLPYSYEMMQSMLSVSNPEDTRLLYISVRHSNAQMAADIANAYARAAKEFIINTMRTEEPSDFSIALVPGYAQTTSRSRSVVMGFLLGSVLAVGILTLLFVLDERPRTPEDISECAGIPTLAVLPSVKERTRQLRKEQSQAKGRREN